MRSVLAGLICVSLLLAGCGGGGGGVTAASPGGGSGGGSSGSGGGTTYNVANAIVDSGPAALASANEAAVNILYVKVTVCAPGSTTNCQTIDHVQVDTGSQGLRLLSSAVNASLLSALQPVTVNGGALAECTQFVDGYSWGPIVTADVHIGGADTATSGESAPGIPVQVIGTTSYAVPTDCANTAGTAENTVTDFYANGIIGLGLFDEDCGTGCSTTVANGYYYGCTTGGSCSAVAVPVANQMVNPVYKLAANNGVMDNNGVIIQLTAVGASGAAAVTGTLVFGIGTQSNNTLAAGATVLTTDSYSGYVTTNLTSLGQSDTTSYLDSGSNGIYFNDSNIPNCTQTLAQGFFCPGAAPASLSATITGTNNQVAAVNFTIGDAYTLFSTHQSYAAFSNLGGSAGSAGVGTFAWGLPFYYGRTVYTAMEKTLAAGTSGPYFAF